MKKITKSEKKILLEILLIAIPSWFIAEGIRTIIQDSFPILNNSLYMIIFGSVLLLMILYFIKIKR